MKLSYNPLTHRRCTCCVSKGGQYPLREVLSILHNREVMLECGHLEYSLEEFKERHPDWTWA